jgi:hypothetical protein
MNLLSVFRKNDITKGIAFGLLSLFILEFGTMVVFAGFDTIRIIWRYYQYFYALFFINIVVAGLLGVGTAKKLKLIKRTALIIILVIFTILIAGYAYFIWFRFSHGV